MAAVPFISRRDDRTPIVQVRRQALVAFLFIVSVLIVLRAARAEEQIDRQFRECSDCPEMVAIPTGRFVMGSPVTEHGRFDAEGPQHAVAVRAFAIGKYDVTIAEFLVFLRETGYQPPPCDPILGLSWPSPGLAYRMGITDPPLWPAHCLNWDDAQAYIAWLNGKVRGTPSAPKGRGGPYRLPSEAEWEYAARAGTTTARWWGDGIGVSKANCNGCGSEWDDELLAPVGSFGPNPFGLYDMLGNVWQWVNDCWNESYAGAPSDGSSWTRGDCSKRVLRGGSWSNVPLFVRSAARSRADAEGGDFDYSSYAGFRVARTLP
jgi:formylglycine-generating enzyme required for sulfatase activity